MELVLKTKLSPKLKTNEEIKKILDSLNDEKIVDVKISTKKLVFEIDRKDERFINCVKNIEVFINSSVGVIVLFGHIQCSFVTPFGAEFFIINHRIGGNIKYEEIKAVPVKLEFYDINPSSIDYTRNFLVNLMQEDNFVFDLEQFSEFLEIFKFYQDISSEINNNENYRIVSQLKDLHFISTQHKEIFDSDNKLLDKYIDFEILNDNSGVLIGYLIPDNVFHRLDNNTKSNVEDLVGIEIEAVGNNFTKIVKQKDNLFASDFSMIDNNNSNRALQLELINIIENKGYIYLYVRNNKFEEYKFINLYDKGQQIKIESIDNSLRLINQGSGGSATRLIEYLIGNEPIPDHQQNLNINDSVEKYTTNLNPSQKKAFYKSIDGSPLTLIKGPPGTGKTHVINAIVQYLTKELKDKVIISSQTHVAIDNVLDKLVENQDPIIPKRITNRFNRYSQENLNKTLFETWGVNAPKYIKKIENANIAKKILSNLEKFEGKQIINFTEGENANYSVTGATTTTTAISGKKGLKIFEGYNWLIIDEVSKCPITEVLRYLPYVEKIILVGDDYQLAPLLEFTKDDVKDLPSYDEDKFDKLEKVYKESVFSKTIKKADQSNRLILLDENYRSTPQIFNTYNVFYGGKLIGRRTGVNDKKVIFKENEFLKNDKDVYFIDSENAVDSKLPGSTSKINVQENVSIGKFLNLVLENCENKKEISVAIIFPYADQLKEFKKENKKNINEARKSFKSFEIDTVDAFQGRETDIVFVSTVVVNLDKRTFLEDFRRINVALSRSRDKLFLFGSRKLKSLEMSSPDGGKRKYLNTIIEFISTKGQPITIKANGEMKNDKRNNEFKFS